MCDVFIQNLFKRSSISEHQLILIRVNISIKQPSKHNTGTTHVQTKFSTSSIQFDSTAVRVMMKWTSYIYNSVLKEAGWSTIKPRIYIKILDVVCLIAVNYHLVKKNSIYIYFSCWIWVFFFISLYKDLLLKEINTISKNGNNYIAFLNRRKALQSVFSSHLRIIPKVSIFLCV